MFDIAQAAIGMDGLGPAMVIPKGYRGQQYLTHIYQNGIILTESPYSDDNPEAKGIRFEGTDGWIMVSRGNLTCSDPGLFPSGEKDQKGPGDVPHEVSPPYMQDFINSVRLSIPE